MNQSENIDQLVTAINGVMKQVGYVQKNTQVGKGNYGYRAAGEADVIGALRPAMVEHGIVIVPVNVKASDLDPIATRNGGTQNRTRVEVLWRVAHESGQWMNAASAGEGCDTGDKSTAKAMTIALKYCWRQMFGLETGDDPDRFASPEPEETKPAAPKPQDSGLATVAELRASIGYAMREGGWAKDDIAASLWALQSRTAADVEDPGMRAKLVKIFNFDTPQRGMAKIGAKAGVLPPTTEKETQDND